MDTQITFTPGEIARAVGVSSRTVIKIGESLGVEFGRTEGGHRRIGEDDAKRLVETLQARQNRLERLLAGAGATA